ncbi:MAG TPA: hypothetical protein DIT47_03595 [Flavobacteriaceae bacterium]|nr:hypothetical protein [Flavobacteriaceae bacterium]
MAAKHFMIYYKKGTGTFVVTEPRPWARENQEFFPNYSFEGNNHPTTDAVEKWLIENKDFKKVIDTKDVVLIQNLNPNIEL